jgi:hypothetical protein
MTIITKKPSKPKSRVFIKETYIQQAFLQWLRLQHPEASKLAFSIPNGGKRDGRYGNRLKREGMKKGALDLGIFKPKNGYHGLFIEFKSAKGRLTQEQAEIAKLLDKEGYCVRVCYSVDEAIGIAKEYLRDAKRDEIRF